MAEEVTAGSADEQQSAGFAEVLGSDDDSAGNAGAERNEVAAKPDNQPDNKSGTDAGEGADGNAQGKQGAAASESDEMSATERLLKSAGNPDEGNGGEQKADDDGSGAMSEEKLWAGIEQKHPDAKTVVGSQEFLAWLGKQDEATQQLAKVGGVWGGVAVLNQFKKEMAVAGQQQQSAGQQQAKDPKAVAEALFTDVLGQKYKDAEGNEKTVGDFCNEVGDYGAALKAVFKRIVDVIGANSGPDIEGLKKDILGSIKPVDTSGVEKTVAEVKFWGDVSSAHPDGRRIWSSREFKDFWAALPAHVQRKYARVTNPDDAIIVIDAFKEHVAKGAAGAGKSKAQEKHQKVNGLYKSAVKQGAGDGAAGTGKKEDYGSGFAAIAGG